MLLAQVVTRNSSQIWRVNAHVTCFSCHTPNAQANGRNSSSCSIFHQLGRLVRTSEQASGFRVGFSHSSHDASEKLACVACHQVRGGLSKGRQVSAPSPLNHHALASSFSCASCHTGKRAFGGYDFSVCKQCHKGSAWHFCRSVSEAMMENFALLCAKARSKTNFGVYSWQMWSKVGRHGPCT
jgi:c(7)-type cytochrome triheme protein